MGAPSTGGAAPTRSLSREKLVDGRTSLRAHLLGGSEQGRTVGGIIRRNVGRKELYPLFACIGAGLVGAAYFAQRHLFNSPNVHVSGEARRMSIKPEAEHKEVARRFTQHRESLAKLAPGYTGKAQ